jgi:hypothetical protein
MTSELRRGDSPRPGPSVWQRHATATLGIESSQLRVHGSAIPSCILHNRLRLARCRCHLSGRRRLHLSTGPPCIVLHHTSQPLSSVCSAPITLEPCEFGPVRCGSAGIDSPHPRDDVLVSSSFSTTSEAIISPSITYLSSKATRRLPSATPSRTSRASLIIGGYIQTLAVTDT